MKLRIIISLAIALVLLSFASAFPADGTFEGDIGATPLIDSVSGSKAKFSEYKDETKGGGLYSDIRLNYDSDNYWMKFNASDIAYKTQNYTLDGGMYGKFTYDLFYNEIIHNITSDAKSFYSGIGSNSLTGTWTNQATLPTNPATWNTFDYYTDRKQYGGGVKV